MTSVDDWLAQDPDGRIDFLKIDVEGAEWAVIQGALSSPKLVCPTIAEKKKKQILKLRSREEYTI